MPGVLPAVASSSACISCVSVGASFYKENFFNTDCHAQSAFQYLTVYNPLQTMKQVTMCTAYILMA